MKNIVDKLKERITTAKLYGINERTNGYIDGINDAIDIINKYIDELIITGNNYFVVMYKDGDKHFPYIEEMRLYKISKNIRTIYYFSRNLNANILNTNTPDLTLTKDLKDRVFFTMKEARASIEK